jgi:hypothetical protein
MSLIKLISYNAQPGLRLYVSLLSFIFLFFSNKSFASAQQVNDAISSYGQLNQTDPQGFILMIVCISMIVVCALSLIGATAFYVFRGSKKTYPVKQIPDS